MNDSFEFSNRNWKAAMLPWIFFPYIMDTSIIKFLLFVIFILSSILLYILSSKKIIFNDNEIIIEKYRWILKKNIVLNYSDIDYIYFTIITMTASSNSALTLLLRNKKKEKVDFFNNEFKSFKLFLVSKKIQIKSNNNDYL
jgi:hypothetical protein